MSKSSEAVKCWRARTKARIVESLGGSCVCCGYNRYFGALECHHIDPSLKKFSFGSVQANSVAWTIIVEELRKCVLVCANCHREIEKKILEIPADAKRFDEKYAEYWIKTRKVGGSIKQFERLAKGTTHPLPICSTCKKTFDGGWKRLYCSPACQTITRTTLPRAEKDILWNDVLEMNIENVGRKYNVSGTTIKTWLRKYDLPYMAKDIRKITKYVPEPRGPYRKTSKSKQTKIEWPHHEIIKIQVLKDGYELVGRDLGVTGAAVKKFLKKKWYRNSKI